MTVRRWLAERLDPESYDHMDELDWLEETIRSHAERLLYEPIASLYRDGHHVGFAPNTHRTLLLVSELDDRAFVASMHRAPLVRPVGMTTATVFRASQEPDELYGLPRFDFYETR